MNFTSIHRALCHYHKGQAEFFPLFVSTRVFKLEVSLLSCCKICCCWHHLLPAKMPEIVENPTGKRKKKFLHIHFTKLWSLYFWSKGKTICRKSTEMRQTSIPYNGLGRHNKLSRSDPVSAVPVWKPFLPIWLIKRENNVNLGLLAWIELGIISLQNWFPNNFGGVVIQKNMTWSERSLRTFGLSWDSYGLR